MPGSILTRSHCVFAYEHQKLELECTLIREVVSKMFIWSTFDTVRMSVMFLWNELFY